MELYEATIGWIFLLWSLILGGPWWQVLGGG